jgi:tetratricopeptide (TPR) repeat protein
VDAAQRQAINEALQLYRQGDAEAAWRRLAALPAGADAETEWARGVAAMATGRQREAAIAATAVLASLPGHSEAAELLAQAAQAAGEPGLARQGLASARRVEGDTPPDGLRIAALELAAGEPAAALARLEALAVRWPGNPSVLLAAGTVLHRGGRPAEAQGWYRRALATGELDPEAEDAATRQLAAACHCSSARHNRMSRGI